MLNFFYRALNNKKGFTLIEVLVVVAIIGILAALAAPRILGRIEDARVSSDQALARTIENAVAQWMFDEDTDIAPQTLSALKTAILTDEYLDEATITLLSTTESTDAGYMSGGVNAGDDVIIKGKTLTITFDPATASCTAPVPTS